MTHRYAILLCASAVATGAFAAACGGHDHGGGPRADEYVHDCETGPEGLPTYATDESFRAVLDKEAAMAWVTDDAQAARLASPPPGATISASVPPTFTLALPLAQLGAPRGGRSGHGPGCPAPRRGRWARVLEALSPIGTAHAHCPGVTGENYLFRLSRPGEGKPVYTALLSVTSFTPAVEPWKKAMAGRAGQTLSLTLARAVFTGGRVASGPFVAAAPATLVVGP